MGPSFQYSFSLYDQLRTQRGQVTSSEQVPNSQRHLYNPKGYPKDKSEVKVYIKKEEEPMDRVQAEQRACGSSESFINPKNKQKNHHH